MRTESHIAGKQVSNSIFQLFLQIIIFTNYYFFTEKTFRTEIV